MFGNAPRAVWEKWAAPDDLNRIELACRALLASPTCYHTASVFDPLSEGRIQVITSRRAYPFRTPLGSVLPPRLDASTGESFPGDYHYNPYTGGALKDAAQPR